MTVSRNPLDLLYLFERVVESGGDAESFWSSLPKNEQTLTLLLDLLLVELWPEADHGVEHDTGEAATCFCDTAFVSSAR